MKYAILVVFALAACSKGNNNSPAAQPPSVTQTTGTNPNAFFLAENIIFGGTALALEGDDPDVDRITKIPAANVMLAEDLDTSGLALGRLKSQNLRDALKDEVAPKLSDVIVGTWDVESQAYAPLLANPHMSVSRCGHTNYELIGARISFASDGTFSVTRGCVVVFGIFACSGFQSECSTELHKVFDGKYRIIGNQVILVEYGYSDNSYTATIATIPEATPDTMSVVNFNSPSLGAEAALFTRVQEGE